MKNMRPYLYKIYEDRIRSFQGSVGLPNIRHYLALVAAAKNVSIEEASEQIEIEIVEFSGLAKGLEKAKTVVFSAEQAEVFRHLSSSYTDGLDYILPYKNTLLQFTRPIEVMTEEGKDYIVALFLAQAALTQEEINAQKELMAVGKAYGTKLQMADVKPGQVINSVYLIYSDDNTRKLTWIGDQTGVLFEKPANSALENLWADMKNLAISCIGYINCENVYLEVQETPEKLVKKHQKKGGEAPEPFYICRIRGVSYEKTVPTGQGVQHSYRYDVRGHFRRYKSSGKTTWVHPHQRGLANELYIPKTYKVESGVKKMRGT